MKIIIAGGGKVGLALVKQLSSEGYEITLIDSRREILEEAVNRYDVMGIQGNCANVSILEQAGVMNADLLIAAIGADEINLLCCMTAHKLNPNLHTIGRIRNPEYNEQAYNMRDTFALSMVVNPEEQAAEEIERLLRYPGFLGRDAFANNSVEIVEIRVDEKSPFCHKAMMDISNISGDKILVCGVVRRGQALIPGGDFVLEANDRIFVTAPTRTLSNLLRQLGIIARRARTVAICGGSMISYYLAKRLAKSGVSVTIIEKDYDRCLYLTENLEKATIIHADATRREEIEREGFQHMDAVVSLTGTDEMNMIISLYAELMGVKQIVTKIAHIDNGEVFSSLPIGSIINPKELCSEAIVRYVRAMDHDSSAAVSIHAIADGLMEAQEFVIDSSCKYCGQPIKALRLKKGVLLCCISHGEEVIIPDGDTIIHEGDSAIVVTTRSNNNIQQFKNIFED